MESPRQAVAWMAQELRDIEAAQFTVPPRAFERIDRLEQLILAALPPEGNPPPPSEGDGGR